MCLQFFLNWLMSVTKVALLITHKILWNPDWNLCWFIVTGWSEWTRTSAAVSERQHLNTVNVYMKWKCWLRASNADMLVSYQVPGTVWYQDGITGSPIICNELHLRLSATRLEWGSAPLNLSLWLPVFLRRRRPFRFMDRSDAWHGLLLYCGDVLGVGGVRSKVQTHDNIT